MSRAPICSGTNVVGQPEEHRHRHEENHRRPVHREQHVVGVRMHQVLFGTASCSRMNSASMPPTTKNTSAVTSIQNADALVIHRREPRHFQCSRCSASGGRRDRGLAGDFIHFNVSM
jgi:hypothetical protein